MNIKQKIYTINENKMKEIKNTILNNNKCFNIVSNNECVVEIPLEKDINLIIYREHNSKNSDTIKWRIKDISVFRIDKNNFCKIEKLTLEQDQKECIYQLARTRSIQDIGCDKHEE